MKERLNTLYHNFCKPQELPEFKTSVAENHQILIDRLSKEDRKTVLRIMDALTMICNYQSKNSFIQGLKLGFELTTELHNYNSRFDEIDSRRAGSSFMPKEEKENEQTNITE